MTQNNITFYDMNLDICEDPRILNYQVDLLN